MSLLAAESISKRFSNQVLLDDVSFTLMAGDRIGLVGKNGIGKTTLLELLTSKQELDRGQLICARNLVIDYVRQEKTEYGFFTLFEYVSQARSDLSKLRTELAELETALAQNPNNNDLLKKFGHRQLQFEQAGGFVFESEIKIILAGLGFALERHTDLMRNFSGGEQNRAGLARILAGRGDLILLDEPTNHLDIDSTRWLEDYLTKLDKAFIVVSHDRAFLSATVNRVWEMALGKIDNYSGGFEFYLKERDDRNRLAEHHYRHQQEEIKRIEEFVRRNMAGQKTKQAQSKLKYLNRIKRLEPPKSDQSGPTIKMESSGRSFNHVLSVEDATVGYGDTAVVKDVSFDLYRGDKIGLIGKNGSGKSTILKSLIGELQPLSGSIKLGNKVEVAYFDQALSDLNTETTVLDNIWEKDRSAEIGVMRSFLARFGFVGEDPFKMVAALSGGEKTKLCLARLLYHPANLIILDEPTNHLDIYAREALDQALIEFEGSCLVVSHDRHFLDRVVDRIIHVADGKAKVYLGNYAAFKAATEPGVSAPKRKSSESKQAFLDFKQKSRQRSKLKKSITATREKIAALEKELETLVSDIIPEISPDDWQALQESGTCRESLENEILNLYTRLDELNETTID